MQIKFTALAVLLLATVLSGCGGGGAVEKEAVHPFPLNQTFQIATSTDWTVPSTTVTFRKG